MDGFLKEVVTTIIKQHQTFEDVVIIVPSQRAGLYVKHLLAQELQKTILSPNIQTVQTFIQESGKLELVDPFELLFACYEAYQKVSETADGFAKFISWAPTLINDFNEIDHYLLDPKTVFSNLAQIKEIDEWSFNVEELSEGQEQFQLFWDLFHPIYHLVNKNLADSGKAYQGQITRQVAENLSQLDIWKNKSLYVVGVNALTAAEETIIKALKQNFDANVYWDNDTYYLDNQAHEAGVFQRRYANSWAPEIYINTGNHIAQPKNITTYETAGNTTQTKLAGQLLQDWKSNSSLEGTALVLADEQLLIPMINSLPEEITKANITMGYPAGQSPIFQFFQLLLAIQEQYKKQQNHTEIHHRLLKELLQHPVLRTCIHVDDLHALLQVMEKENKVYLSVEDLTTHFKNQPEALHLILPAIQPWVSLPADCFNTWGKLAQTLQQNIENKIDKELLFMFSGLLKKLSALTTNYQYLTDLDVLKNFIQRLISKELIPFFGEPLQGLQIMGMLETRALDFERIIILSVNEGVLPKGNNQPSFIPHDLKKHYQLPTHYEKDAIYAFHFYRLIQRAKEVHLIYNTAKDGLTKGEKSRFITQLSLEYPQSMNHITVDIPYQKETWLTDIAVTDDLNTQINYYLTTKGLSPSALNTYLRCPKDFALKYLLNIKEPDVVEENLKDNSIGTIVHAVLEQLFSPFINQVIQVADCENMIKQVDPFTEQAFKKEFPFITLTSGINYLAVEVAKKQLHHFIKRQIKELKQSHFPLTILALEKEFNCSILVGDTTVKLKGIIDRIDKVGDQIRVLDYKTGKVDPKTLKTSKTFGSFQTSEDWNHEAFKWSSDKNNQLLFYLFAAFESQVVEIKNPAQLSAGIIALNNVSDDAVFFLNDYQQAPVEWSSDTHEFIKDALQEIIAQIMHPTSHEFIHADRNPSYCLLC